MSSSDCVREVLERAQTIELLAAIEHERWASWQRYVHNHCQRQEDGSLVIPPDLAARWNAQIETPYEGLSEQEKDSDREQVHRYLDTIIDALTR